MRRGHHRRRVHLRRGVRRIDHRCSRVIAQLRARDWRILRHCWHRIGRGLFCLQLIYRNPRHISPWNSLHLDFKLIHLLRRTTNIHELRVVVHFLEEAGADVLRVRHGLRLVSRLGPLGSDVFRVHHYLFGLILHKHISIRMLLIIISNL